VGEIARAVAAKKCLFRAPVVHLCWGVNIYRLGRNPLQLSLQLGGIRVRGENFSWKKFLMEIREISHTPESLFMGKYGKFSHILVSLVEFE
jgi:hypothetical protein